MITKTSINVNICRHKQGLFSMQNEKNSQSIKENNVSILSDKSVVNTLLSAA